MKRKIFLLVITTLILFCSPKNSVAQAEDFQVGELTRSMLVYAPAGLEPNRPLLLSLHGMNQDINYQQNQTKWEDVAREHGFVVVYPGGIDNSWDIGGTRDIDFILAIIDEMYDRHQIDRDRVYLSGFSMGGMMTYHAANHIADKIAAFAPVSGYRMQGPNTESSRPIPLIHVHGTTDDVVAYSGVQPCLDAWIERNNCDTIPIVTEPYPADKPSSNGTKYYWGNGIDSVAVVLLRLQGVGHWHSLDNNGVHTSQEIWKFCSQYSLGFGVPKFQNALVNDIDPKQILASFSLPIKESDSIRGFSVRVDEQTAQIDSIVLVGSNQLAVFLADSILKINEIILSYSDGNVESTFDKDLVEFADAIVDNQLYGSSPRILEIYTTGEGDSLVLRFNKEMLLPSDISSLALNAFIEENQSVSLLSCSFLDNDSTAFAFPLDQQIFADYVLTLTYSGSNIVSADSGALNMFTDLAIDNRSKGLTVEILSGALEPSAISIALEFSKPMAMNNDQKDQISIYVNGESIVTEEVFVSRSTVRFVLSENLYYGDSISVSYTPGNITAADGGELEAFADFSVDNPLPAPTYTPIPGKIEAEDYTLQFGTDTEETSDEGGGLNVGWFDSDDWLVYAIENNTDETEFGISFRIAAESSGGKFDYYIGEEKAGTLNIPGTGGWQSWQSVSQNITIPAGQHYFKIVTITGLFNINYFDIHEPISEEPSTDEPTNTARSDMNSSFMIYPNPASNLISIKSPDFHFNRIEIIDMMGRTVISRSTPYEPQVQLPISLSNGVYTVKISNARDSIIRKVIVKNE